jgi:hypothetical protein
MTKIEQIEQAIENAIQRKSKLSEENYKVSGLVSLLGRHLYNNLGALSTRFLEIGSHLGCSFTSSITNNNLITATSVDSFASDWVEDRQCMPIFLDNVSKFLPKETIFNFIHSDAFEVNLLQVPKNIDFYIYDGSHDELSQYRALEYYYTILADEFIFVVDDFDWKEVKDGTYNAIKKCNFDILFESVLVGNNHDNDGAWNGYGIFLLKKRK